MFMCCMSVFFFRYLSFPHGVLSSAGTRGDPEHSDTDPHKSALSDSSFSMCLHTQALEEIRSTQILTAAAEVAIQDALEKMEKTVKI